MVPQIWSDTDRIFLSFWTIFCLFTSTPTPTHNNPENQNFEKKKKWKKCLEILSFYTYMCTINEDHMIYGYWNIRCNRKKFSTFSVIFCPFSPLMENQNFNIEKITWRYYHFTHLHHKWQTYNVWFLRYGAQQT